MDNPSSDENTRIFSFSEELVPGDPSRGEMITSDASTEEMIPEDDEPMLHRSSALVSEQRTVQLYQTNNNNNNAIERTSKDTIPRRKIPREDVWSDLCSPIIRRTTRRTQSETLHQLNNDKNRPTPLSRSMPERKIRSSLSLQLNTIGENSKMCATPGSPIDGQPLSPLDFDGVLPSCPSLGSSVTHTSNHHNVGLSFMGICSGSTHQTTEGPSSTEATGIHVATEATHRCTSFHRSHARVLREQRTVQLDQTNNNDNNAIEGISIDTIPGRKISQETDENVRSNLSCSPIDSNPPTPLLQRRVRSSLSLQLSTVLSIGEYSVICCPPGSPIDGQPLSPLDFAGVLPLCPSLGSGVTRTSNPHDVGLSFMDFSSVEDLVNEAIVAADEMSGNVTVDVDGASTVVDAASGVENAPYTEVDIHPEGICSGSTHQTEGPSPQAASPTNILQEGAGSTAEESPLENTSSPRSSTPNDGTQLECHLSVQGNSIRVYNSVTGSDTTSHVLQGDETLTILLGEYEVTVKRSENDS